MVASLERTTTSRQDLSMLSSPESVVSLWRINVINYIAISSASKKTIYAKTLGLAESTDSRDLATPFIYTCLLYKSYTTLGPAGL